MNETRHIVDCSADPFIPNDERKILYYYSGTNKFRGLQVWVEKHEKVRNIVIERAWVVLYPVLPFKSEKYNDDEPYRALIEDIHLNTFCQDLDKMQGLIANANVLDYLLLHPELIPAEWPKKTILFPGTIYQYSAEESCYGPYSNSYFWSDVRGSFIRGLCYDHSDRKWGWSCYKIDGNGCIRTSIYGDTCMARLI